MQEVRHHLAIPSADILKSMQFYTQLGFKLGRFNDVSCIINFFGLQLVCHKSDDIDLDPQMYPRHFGIITTQEKWTALCSKAKELKVRFFREPFLRYDGEPSEHGTFFIMDPSNNLIEFKYYKDETMI